MTWDEWERSKARADDQGSVNMRLNQLAPTDGGGGGGGDGGQRLVVHQDELGAVGHDAFELHDRLRKQVDIAGAGSGGGDAGSTMQAASEMKSSNFTMGSALEDTVSLWTSQVKSVLQACAHISNHLDYTKQQHAKDDAQIEAEIRHRDGSAVTVSELSKYFK
jgi:hypothetical protein